MAIFEDKRHKADYISLQLQFMGDLTELSLKLKDPSIGKDKTKWLFQQLSRINGWIETRVRSEAQKVQLPETKSKFKGGIVFPMKIGDDRDPFVILGNIPELSAVFETKARAPYKIVFEVCRLSELIEETMKEEQGVAATDTPLEEEKKDAAADQPGITGPGSGHASEDSKGSIGDQAEEQKSSSKTTGQEGLA